MYSCEILYIYIYIYIYIHIILISNMYCYGLHLDNFKETSRDCMWDRRVTKLLVSSLIVGHQNRLWRNSRTWIVPGWQVRREKWPHWRTWEWTDFGINKQLVGPPPGSGSRTWAYLIVLSSSHHTGATILELVIMGVIGSSRLLFAYTRDRASGLRFFVPGR